MIPLCRWFVAHWFSGVFAIVAVIWVITMIAYASGADSVSFGNRYTHQDATIDFEREHDHPIYELAEGLGLEIDPGTPPRRASIVRLDAGIPIICWLCGKLHKSGGIAMADFRRGDWFYRAPSDDSHNSEALHGRRAESRAYILTLAYNRRTGERIQVEATTTVAEQVLLLQSHGLAVSDADRLAPAALADLASLSIQREGCVIVNAAFVAVTLLWLVVGGLALALGAMVRRMRSRRR
ncbi:MAG: hypothetical protein H6Q90_142 [Deltaproteobacteria bacterium]|nr:hypothetical protein [Deltaproteobacteria bacterium]